MPWPLAGSQNDVNRAKSLFILDDEPFVAETLAAMASGLGMSTQSFTCATEFLVAAQSNEPGYVIMDLRMPKIDGIETIRRLAELDCKAGVILTSGLGKRVLNAAILSAEEHGLKIVGTLPKPFLMRHLSQLLDTDQPKHRRSGVPQEPPHELSITAADLHQAMAHQELMMVYQPKISCATRQLRGVEALVRWNHPSGVVINPNKFIPLAEREGLMPELTLYTVRQTLAWFSSVRGRLSENENGLTVSINISARCFQTIDFADQLDTLCEAMCIPNSDVILELTETAAAEDQTTSLDTITRLCMKGFCLSIDDFGTGYSSMAQLTRLPFSELKIDKSFVLAAQHSSESRAMIAASIGLGKSLGMQTTAEGIEDEATLDLLTREGCDQAQGFFIGRPMKPDDFDTWAEHRKQKNHAVNDFPVEDREKPCKAVHEQ